MNFETEVTIMGAGLTGLSIALFLKTSGISVTILEKSNNVGGVMQTHSNNGFVYESGPNTGVLSTPELVELFDILGNTCQPEIANADAKKRWIWKKGKWCPLPSGLISAIGTPLFSMYDKFRILGEPFRKPGKNPVESVAEMVKRRLGKSYLDYAVDPFISGVYAGDPEKLITRFALPKLYNLEQQYGSFVKGSFKKAKEPKTDLQQRATKDVFSVPGGFQNLVNSLAEKVGPENIMTGCHNMKVKPNDSNFEVICINDKKENITLTSKKLVSTFSGNHFNEVFPFIETNLISAIKTMEYARIAQVAVGFKKWQGIKLGAFGGLIPSKENKDILGILFPSSIFKNRAPKEGALLSVFIGGRRKPHLVDLSENDLKKLVLDSILHMMQFNNPEPDLFEIFRYDHAIPQYEISSAKRLEAIGKIEAQFPGLIMAGNIRDGIGIADRVKQAKMISDQLISTK